MQTKSIFIGLILGGVILLFKQISTKEEFKKRNLLYLLVSLIIGISMVFIENKIGIENLENVVILL